MLVVEFDPEDAVSVPTDCDFQKLRVCKYKVVSDITDTKIELSKPVYEAEWPIYGSNKEADEDLLADVTVVADDVCECDDADEELTHLAIRNYIENKHMEGYNPTIKHIADLKVSRDDGLRCSDIARLVEDLGFELEEDDSKTLSALEVL